VVRAILEVEPTRGDKAELLGRLRDRGVFLIDLKPDKPMDGTPLAGYVDDLVKRIKKLHPDKIVLIKASVYAAAYLELSKAGLPVVDERVPFPVRGAQPRFEKLFGRALNGP